MKLLRAYKRGKQDLFDTHYPNKQVQYFAIDLFSIITRNEQREEKMKQNWTHIFSLFVMLLLFIHLNDGNNSASNSQSIFGRRSGSEIRTEKRTKVDFDLLKCSMNSTESCLKIIKSLKLEVSLWQTVKILKRSFPLSRFWIGKEKKMEVCQSN